MLAVLPRGEGKFAGKSSLSKYSCLTSKEKQFTEDGGRWLCCLLTATLYINVATGHDHSSDLSVHNTAILY